MQLQKIRNGLINYGAVFTFGPVLVGLHLQYVGQHGVQLDVPDQASEEYLLDDVALEGAEGGEPEQQLGEPVPVPAGGAGAVRSQLDHSCVTDKVQVLGARRQLV